jgi:hypothetical protein
MKHIRIFVAAVVVTVFTGCRQNPDPETILRKLESDLIEGNFARMKILADSIKKLVPPDSKLNVRADSWSRSQEELKLIFLFQKKF